MSAIPCKQPRVILHAAEIDGELTHRVQCLVPGCSWSYGPAVKVDAQDQAKWHREHHRAAVPKVTGDACACGWTPAAGVVTKTDRKASLQSHLALQHGLVSC